MKRIVFLVAAALFSGESRAADFSDYASGCLQVLGGSIAGTALASTQLEGTKITTQGYLISGVGGCLVGIAYVGIVGAQAEFEATYKLQRDNAVLSAMKDRLATELCLRGGDCDETAPVRVAPGIPELKKVGDKVYQTQTWEMVPIDERP